MEGLFGDLSTGQPIIVTVCYVVCALNHLVVVRRKNFCSWWHITVVACGDVYTLRHHATPCYLKLLHPLCDS